MPFLKASSPEIVSDKTSWRKEEVMTYPVVEHPDDGGTLEVRDDVEDLVHLAGMLHLHLDVVGCNIEITD